MKNKIIKIMALTLLVSILAVALVSCSEEPVRLDTDIWELYSVQDGEGKYTHGGKELSKTFSHVEYIDATLVANDYTFTLTDDTNDKTYTGSYSNYNKTKGTLIYKAMIGKEKANVVVSVTKFKDHSETDTLVIEIDGRTLTFYGEAK